MNRLLDLAEAYVEIARLKSNDKGDPGSSKFNLVGDISRYVLIFLVQRREESIAIELAACSFSPTPLVSCLPDRGVPKFHRVQPLLIKKVDESADGKLPALFQGRQIPK